MRDFIVDNTFIKSDLEYVEIIDNIENEINSLNNEKDQLWSKMGWIEGDFVEILIVLYLITLLLLFPVRYLIILTILSMKTMRRNT